jgi:purine-binding chemotaxis protein CheW
VQSTTSEQKTLSKYLIFQLGQETYGTPLLGVREVVEFKEPKPVPNSAKGFEGVINLRGEVIGVIDIRKLLGIDGSHPQAMLVFESEMGVMGTYVDRVLSVTEIMDADIERKNTSAGQQQRDYYLGVGKTSSGLITLIDLKLVTQLLK